MNNVYNKVSMLQYYYEKNIFFWLKQVCFPLIVDYKYK